MILVLIMLGLNLMKLNRFYEAKYAAFKASLRKAGNVHPSARRRNHNVYVAMVFVLIIFMLHKVISNQINLVFWIGIAALAVWDVITIPSVIRENRQWFNGLGAADQAIYSQYKKSLRQIIILVAIFLGYGLIAMRFLP
jgi:hypothetical protein